MEKMHTWARGLDFQKTLRSLLARYRRARRPKLRGVLAVMLIQLTNGCRVSEAIEALREYAATGRRQVRVKVKKRKDAATRLVVIPEFVEREVVPSKRLVQFYAQKYGFTTHALRYAFITEMARRGVAAQLIAKMTGHKKLDRILDYTEQVKAEDVLTEMVAQLTRRGKAGEGEGGESGGEA